MKVKEKVEVAYWSSPTGPASGSSLALFFDASCAVVFCLVATSTALTHQNRFGTVNMEDNVNIK